MLELECIHLFATEAEADVFVAKLQAYGNSPEHLLKIQRQLNHPFAGGNALDIYQKLGMQMSLGDQEALHRLCLHSNNHVVKTCSVLPGDKTMLIVTSSDTQEVGYSTREVFECYFPDRTIDELDLTLLDIGRERSMSGSGIVTEYHIDAIIITLRPNSNNTITVSYRSKLTLGESADSALQRIQSLVGQLA